MKYIKARHYIIVDDASFLHKVIHITFVHAKFL